MDRTLLRYCLRSFSNCSKPHCRPNASLRHTPRAVPSPSVQHACLSRSRYYHATACQNASRPPKSRDNATQGSEQQRTDFASLDVLRNTAAPATSVDACVEDGFVLDNHMNINGGVLLVGGEAYRWRPWLRGDRKEGTIAQGGMGDDAMTGRLQNAKGQWEVQEEAWGLLDLVYPKPDLLIIGTGPNVIPLAPAVRSYLNNLGLRLEVSDTRNAAAQFNLLATERGVEQVAAAMIPMGWKEGR